MLMEGVAELILAFLLADSVAVVFSAFPLSVIGAMLFFASVELGKSVIKVRERAEIVMVIVVGVASLLTNLAVGFLLGLAFHCLARAKLFWRMSNSRQ